MPTETAARPDLSALPWDVRLRIAVAESLGATWKPDRWVAEETMAVLQFPAASFHDVLVYATSAGAVDYDHQGALPDYPGDPAAWGALAKKELAGLHQKSPGGPWQAQWWTPQGELDIGPIRADIGEAAAFGVLAKLDHPDLMALLLESRP